MSRFAAGLGIGPRDVDGMTVMELSPHLVVPREIRVAQPRPEPEPEAPKVVVNNFQPPQLKEVSGGARPQLMQLGPMRWVVFSFAIIAFIVAILLPYSTLIAVSLSKSWGLDFWKGLTLQNFLRHSQVAAHLANFIFE